MKKTDSLDKVLAKYGKKSKKMQVGFFENATYAEKDESDQTVYVAQVAAANEYGTDKIPSRPFFRSTIKEHKDEWIAAVTQLAKQHDVEKAMRLTGEKIKNDLAVTITTWTAPPNAAKTIAEKGFNAPLRDTMTMARSIDIEVSDDEY